MNLIGYVKKYGNESFSERTLNEVDSLVFSELSYLNFTDILNFSAPRATMGELASEHLKTLVSDTLLPKSNKKLLNAIAASPRFSNVRVGWFSEYNNKEKEVRFAAVTFRTDAGYYVAFRGTDVTLLGWKEDFNMAFLSKIPSQELAADYLGKVAEKTGGSLTIGGHSKGGNLALYAAVNAAPKVRRRIAAVYNHDGPGFHEQIFSQEGYREIAKRVHKTVPHDSLIGILLHHTDDYKVVPSKSVLIGQHNPFAWTVKNAEQFAELKGTTRNSRRMDSALSDWIAGMNDETRERFVSVLFKIIEGSGAEKVPQFLHGAFGKIGKMKKTFQTFPEEDRNLILQGGKDFLSLWFHALKKTGK